MVNEVLEECILAYPVSSFIISLYKHYLKYGTLSKKQLEGLLAKATQANTIAPGKLATLEALIKKMPTRYKSEAPPPTPLYQKEDSVGQQIEAILAKYPQHKRVLFLQAKFRNNEPLTSVELGDLKRLKSMLIG